MIPDPDLAVDYDAAAVVFDAGAYHPGYGSPWRPGPYPYVVTPRVSWPGATTLLYWYPAGMIYADPDYLHEVPELTAGADFSGSGSDVWTADPPCGRTGTAAAGDGNYRTSTDCCFAIPWFRYSGCAFGYNSGGKTGVIFRWGGRNDEFEGVSLSDAYSGLHVYPRPVVGPGGQPAGTLEFWLGADGTGLQYGQGTTVLEEGSYYSLVGWYTEATRVGTLVLYSCDPATGAQTELERIILAALAGGSSLSWYKDTCYVQHQDWYGGRHFWGAVSGIRLWGNWAPSSDQDLKDALSWGSAPTAACLAAIDRLPQQFKASEKLKLLLCIYASQCQSITDAAAQVRDERFTLSVAAGVQLDGLGSNLGLLRNGLTDAEYRPALAARILASSGDDHPDDMLSVVRAAFLGETLVLSEEYPAVFTVTIVEEISNALLGILVGAMLHDARPAGVHSILYFRDLPDGELFAISSTPDTPETDAATGFGTVSDPDVGGGLRFAR